MYIIGVYDINRKRVQKVMKTFRKHLLHVQNSVFEGEISDKSFAKLNYSLDKIMNRKEDYVIFYKFHHKNVFRKIEKGTSKTIISNII